LIISFP